MTPPRAGFSFLEADLDRQIVYPQSLPQDTDILNTNRNALVGLGLFILDVFGTSTVVGGLPCTPTAPATLGVLIAPGRIYSLQNIDGTPYGSLPADANDQIVKQGIQFGNVTLETPAPATAGFSINYLIEAAYQDSDTNAVVLPFFNSNSPQGPSFQGQNNSGLPLPTRRQGLLVVQAKAGIATTTGTQTTPAPDVGFVGLYVVTVASGQGNVTAANIAQMVGAPFMSANGAVHGSHQFTASGTFIVPPGVTLIYVSGCAAGGGGGGGGGCAGTALTVGGGGGGGAGQSMIKTPFVVVPGQTIPITIGGGGAGGLGGAAGGNLGTNGGTGGNTSIGSLATLLGAAGGAGGTGTGSGAGGQGGSGFPTGAFGSDAQGGAEGGMGASGPFGGGGGNARGTLTGAGINGFPAGGFGGGGGGGGGPYGATTAAGGSGAAGSGGFALFDW
jgi:hypothetical protein